MSWTTVPSVSTTFALPADSQNGYVQTGYVANGYITGKPVWADVEQESTEWA